MSLDRFPDLLSSQLKERREDKRVVLEWRHETPRRAQDYLFKSVMTQEEGGGYQLESSPPQWQQSAL